jgi:hypothetical protein
MMQGDTNFNNLKIDTINSYNVFCKPNNSLNKLTKSDSLQLQQDSLSFKYFFDYTYNHFVKKTPNLLVAKRESMFTSHQLVVKNIHPFERKGYTYDWIALLLLICFSILAWTLIFSRKRLKQIFKATYSNRTINQLIRDGDLFKERIAINFILIYFLSFSLFIFKVTQTYHIFDFYSFSFFLKILVGITLLYFFKQIATKFIGVLFKNTSASYVYMLNGFIFNLIIGIVLLPFLLFMVYSNAAISSISTIFGIVIILILSVIKYIRYFIIGVSYSKFSQFYLFLYLCTLEILPILIIVKIIIGLINSKI